MISRYGRKCPKQIAGFKNLLKYANGFNTFEGQSFSISGKEAEPTLIPAIKIYAFIPSLVFGNDVRADFPEVFLKASMAAGSFFT